VPPGPGADYPVDIVVLGESHHLGPSLLVRDAAGAAKETIVFALKRPCGGLWTSDFGEGGSVLGDDGGDAEEEEADNDHDDDGEVTQVAGEKGATEGAEEITEDDGNGDHFEFPAITDNNVIEAAGNGAHTAIDLVLNIGAMLIVAYCSLAAAFFVHKDPPGLPRPPSLPPSYTYDSR